MSFITYVQPSPSGADRETLGILISKTENGTRGNAMLIQPNGTTSTIVNVPLDGNQIEGGAHLKLEPPANLAPAEEESGYSR